MDPMDGPTVASVSNVSSYSLRRSCNLLGYGAEPGGLHKDRVRRISPAPTREERRGLLGRAVFCFFFVDELCKLGIRGTRLIESKERGAIFWDRVSGRIVESRNLCV